MADPIDDFLFDPNIDKDDVDKGEENILMDDYTEDNETFGEAETSLNLPEVSEIEVILEV